MLGSGAWSISTRARLRTIELISSSNTAGLFRHVVLHSPLRDAAAECSSQTDLELAVKPRHARNQSVCVKLHLQCVHVFMCTSV